jgi:hypothetical protein
MYATQPFLDQAIFLSLVSQGSRLALAHLLATANRRKLVESAVEPFDRRRCVDRLYVDMF